ncbi:MAG: winged helix-turn-helix domain-containing protein [Deltaproteobacteria bacterium]|nr:winged helix-turn-helix domain-containing protein [Deltaproteobacteria bacterium]
MSIALEKLKDRLVSLPPSQVWLTAGLDKIEEETQHYRVVFIRGRPLTGRTTLMQQLLTTSKMSGKRAHLISFSADTNLLSAIQKIAEEIGVVMAFDHPDALRQLPSLQDEILKLCNEEKILLLLDGVDRIQDGKSWLDFILKNITEATIVMTCAAIPELDPTLIMDAGIIKWNGLNLEEVEKLIEKSRVQVPAEDAEGLKRKIFNACGGNPFLLKMMLSPAIIEGRPLAETDVEKNFTEVKNKYFSRILDSFIPELKEKIQLAGFIEFDLSLEKEIINSFSIRERHMLLGLGFIQSMDNPVLIDEIKEFIREICKDFQSVQRTEILNILKSKDSYLSKKESVWQFLQTNQISEAAKEFEFIAKEMEKNGEFSDFLKLSDPLVEMLSIESLLVRRAVFNYLNRLEDPIPELEAALLKSVGDDERFQIYLALGRSYFLISKFDESIQLLDRILEKCEPHEPSHLQALLYKAEFVCTKNPSLCKSLLDQAHLLLNKCVHQTHYLWADYYIYEGLYFHIIGNQKKAAASYRLAIPIYRLNRIVSVELVAESNAWTCEYDLGNVDQALIEKKKVLDRAEKLGLLRVVSFCQLFFSTHLIGQGQFKKSEQILISIINSNVNGPMGRDEFQRIRRLVYLHIGSGNFQGALEVLRKISGSSALKDDPESGIVLKQLYDFLTIRLQGGWNKFKWNAASRVERSQLSEGSLIRLHLNLMEINFLEKFPVELETLAPDFLEFFKETTDLDITTAYRCLLGYHFLVQGKLQAGKLLLLQALSTSKKYEYFIWEFRCLLALALLELNSNRNADALGILQNASLLLNKFDSHEDEEFIKALLAIANLKLGDQQEFEKSLRSLNPKKPHAYFYEILESFTVQTKRSSKVSILPHQKNYFDKILSLAGIGGIREVVLKTNQSASVYFENQLPELNTNKFDIIFDDIKSEVRAAKLNFSIKGKYLLTHLLRFLLERAGEKFSKEDLTVLVWHETYNPLVHDSRIYTSIKRIREILKETKLEEMIQEDGGKYFVSHSLKYAILSLKNSADDLSERERWILEFLKNNEFIDRNSIQNLLKISSTSAKQELKSLLDRGLIKITGKGKSTKYQKTMG